jgi:hypothetical protein
MTICIAARCKDENGDSCFAFCCDREVQMDSARAELVIKLRPLGQRWTALMVGVMAQAKEMVDIYRHHFQTSPFTTRLTSCIPNTAW